MATGTAEDRLQLTGTWEIDPAHSSVAFSAKHMMISSVRGGFGEVAGRIVIAEDPAELSAEARIKAGSISTANADRDVHLKSPDFLDVDKYPEIVFKSTGGELLSEKEARLYGDLTIKAVTRPVALDVALNGFVPRDMYGNARASFSGRTEIDRKDFGLTWNVALETGGFLVGDDVRIELEIAAVRAS